jgi:hypothetical protein
MWAQNEQHQKWNILKKKCLIPKIIVYQQSNLTLLKNPQQLSIGVALGIHKLYLSI